MAKTSTLLVEFNKAKEGFFATNQLDGKTGKAVFQLCDTLKDLLVESELQCAVLKGRLQALNGDTPGRQNRPRQTPLEAAATPAAAAPAATCASKPRDRSKKGRPKQVTQLRRAEDETVTNTQPTVTGPAPSYAAVAKSGVAKPQQSKAPAARSRQPRAPRGTVVLQARDKSGQDLRRILSDKINPSSIGVSVRNIYAGPSKVIVNVRGKDQAQRLIKAVTEEVVIPELTAKEAPGKVSSLIVFGVPTTRTEEEVQAALVSASGADPSNFTIHSSLPGKKDSVQHWTLSTTPAVASKLVKGKRIHIGFAACPVRKRLRLQRCFRCQRLGHTQVRCTFPVRCAACSGQHEQQACKQVVAQCINCMRANRLQGSCLSTDHPASHPSCHSFREALVLLKEGKAWQNPSQEEDVPPAEDLLPSLPPDQVCLPATLPATEPAPAPASEPLPAPVTSEVPQRPQSPEASPPQPPVLRPRRQRIRSPVHSRSPSPVLSSGVGAPHLLEEEFPALQLTSIPETQEHRP